MVPSNAVSQQLEEEYKKYLPQKRLILTIGHPPGIHQNINHSYSNTNNLSNISYFSSSDDEPQITVRTTRITSKRY